MSSGKANSRSILNNLKQLKGNITRSGRRSTSTYARDGSGAGGSGGGLGRGGVGGGGVDFEPPPSASGDVAPELFLEGPSRQQAETETESPDEDSGDEEGEGEPQLKKLPTRGESKVPDERKEPKTEEAKALIKPHGKE